MYLYSNIIGTFVFNEHFRLREHVFFNKDQLPEIAVLLEERKKLPSERKYLEKFSSIIDLRKTRDTKMLHNALQAMRLYTDKFREADLFLTRQRIKQGVTGDDLIIQTHYTIKELQRVTERLTKRLREWYALSAPRIEKETTDHEKLVKAVLQHARPPKDKKGMGADFSREDFQPLIDLAEQIQELSVLLTKEEVYLKKIMKKYCPNIRAITGAVIGAELLSMAGSLRKLALYPASTIQLLGAEKALFRHMTRNTSPPKYGLLFQHPLVQQAPKSSRGKMARVLADKISIASRIDFFKGEYKGDSLYNEVEQTFKEVRER